MFGVNAGLGSRFRQLAQNLSHRLRLPGREAGRHQLGTVGVRQQRVA